MELADVVAIHTVAKLVISPDDARVFVKNLKIFMDILSLTKEARVYNGEKTISLTSGAWKTGQPLVKE